MANLRSTIRKVQLALYRDPSLSPAIEPLGHAYPWQLYTKHNDVQLTAQLESDYPVDKLVAELAAVLQAYTPKQQFGQYHAGGWRGVALHAIDGDPTEDQDRPEATFAKTPALELAPTMESIIDSFPCEKRRVRILQLAPGRKIFWHRDFWHSVDSTQLRLHIPIITNDKIGFQISHQDCRWKAGELWYGDFTFPHRLQNGGDESRAHLVIDLINNEALRSMLPESILRQREARGKARKRCNSLMNAWSQIFATENRLAAARKTRDS